MKKYFVITLLALFIFPSIASASLNYSRTPTGSEVSSPVTLTVSFTDWENDFSHGDYTQTDTWCLEISGPDEVYYSPLISSATLSYDFVITGPIGEYGGLIATTGEGGYSDCVDIQNNTEYGDSTIVNDTDFFTLVEGGGGGEGIMGLINSSNTGFGEVTGFPISEITSWAGQNLALLFVGSGMAVLFELRYWIMALLVIGGIVYFAYRAINMAGTINRK